MVRLGAWGAVVAGIASLAAGSAGADDHLWARIGATDAQVETDLADCRAESSKVEVEAGYQAEALAGLIGAAIVAAAKKPHAEHVFTAHCMKRRGYVWLPLTDVEARELDGDRLPGDRAAWIDRFYAGDLTERLDAAWKPLVPPLPEAVDERFSFDGVRFDPVKLVVSADPVGSGGTVLSGPVTHQATARLAAPIETATTPSLHAVAGTELYQIVAPTRYDPAQTYWCGPFKSMGLLAHPTVTTCVFAGDTGYEFISVGGEAWLGPLPSPDDFHTTDVTAKVALTPSETDLFGPMDFTLVVRRVAKSGVDVEAWAAMNGRKTMFWSGELAFDPDGKTVLPFWSHQLALTRQDKTVKAVFTPNGDGRGWMEAPWRE
ncbi:MAG TPA: hypothetical protein VGF71_11520 [Caulobacteraceae bacterium]